MKCKAMVVYKDARQKGSGKPYQKKVDFFAYEWYKHNPEILTDGAIECDGNIIVNIIAEDEASWGCTYAVLKIDYICDKCGARAFNELPQNSDELSTFMTKAIAVMTDEVRDEVLDERKANRDMFHKRAEELRVKL